MKRLLWILLLMASFSDSFASSSKIDSLRTVADTISTDSGKAKTLDYLVWEYMNSDVEEAIIVAYEQVASAKRSSVPNILSKAYFNLATAHAQKGQLKESVPIFYQALEQANKANSPKKKSQIYNNLGLVYKFISQPDSAIICYKRSVDAYKTLDDLEKGLSTAYNNIAQLYLDNGDLDSSLKYSNEALNIHLKLNINDYSTSDILNNLGINFEQRGNYPKALGYLLRSRKIYDAQKDTSNKYGYILNNIGIIYNKQEDYNKALEYFKMSAEVIGKVGSDAASYGKVMNNIGQIYIQRNELDTALNILNEAKSVQENLAIKSTELANTYSNIGQIYEIKEEYDLAEVYFKKSLEISEEENIKPIMVEAYFDLGRLQILKGAVTTGIELCAKSLKIAEETDLLEAKMLACECLYEGNDKLGRIANAYKYYKLYREYRDVLINQENTKEITQKAMQYEFDRVQYQDSLNRAEAERKKAMIQKEKDIRQEAEIQKQRAYTIAIGVGFSLMLGLAFVLFKGYKNKQKANEIITEQKEAVELQKEIIEEKNREIVDSISYAQRIQNAILPSDSYIKEILPEAFVYFNPKDIVSGDFYWVDEKDGNVFFAAVDCTGHGVPGALVSVVGYNGLNRVLHEFNLTEPSKMLDKLSEIIEKTFSQSTSNIKDGMDIALCKWDKKNNTLEYAGANNPLYLIRDSEKLDSKIREHRVIEDSELKKALVEFKPDKQPVGVFEFRESFTNYKIPLFKGDSIYVFSDGYADQFGGEKGKKFMYRPFKMMLTQLSEFSMADQKIRIMENFNKWKGNMEQIDDVCVLGVKI